MKFLLGLLAALPAPAGYVLARMIFLLLFYVIRYRRATVRENLAFAFPDVKPAELRSLERRAYLHFCNLVIEVLRSTRMRQEEFAERVSFANLEVLAQATENFDRQAIVMMIHQGNWEWMLHGSMAQLPVPTDPVYKPLHSPFWDQLILEARSRFGATPMPIASVGRAVIAGRKRKRLIIMLADQAGPKKEGYWVQFLNRPASFHRGADKLARTLRLPVLFAQCTLLERGHYEIRFHEISDPGQPVSAENILDRYVQIAEQVIAEQPETYLWTNRRWKKTPPEDASIARPGWPKDTQNTK